MCPRCATVLTSSQVHVIGHVAFCTRCGLAEWWACLRDAQMLHTLHFQQDQAVSSGIRWYTPEVAGPPNLLALATLRKVDSIYATFPCTPDGYRISKPEPVSVDELNDEREQFIGSS